MVKDIVKKIIVSIIVNIIWFAMIMLVDSFAYIDSFYEMIIRYEDIIQGIILYIILCSQGIICMHPPLNSKRETIIFTIISFAIVLYIFGYLIF